MPQIFRAKSLARLSSPEQLDRLTQVTSPMGWVALTVTCALMVAVVLWGLFGSLETKVSGPGMIVHRKGQLPITSVGSGEVTEVFVEVGETVRAGQVVARIAQPSLLHAMLESRGDLAQAREEHQKLVEFYAREAQNDIQSGRKQIDAVQSYKTSLEQRVAFLRTQLKNDQALVTKGLMASVDIQNTRNSLTDAEDLVQQNVVRLAELQATLDQNDHTRKRALMDSDNKVRSLERILTTREAELARNTQVISGVTGRVVEIAAQPGDVVVMGATILSLAEEHEKLEAVLYVNARDGKRVKTGMAGTVVPSTVKQEETGSMLGIVTDVAEFPSTREGMMRQLGNEPLVSQLSQSGAVMAVHVDLIPDAEVPGGYRWTSRRGGKLTIEPGTLCGAELSVETKLPITLVIPYIVKWLGL
jgi:HlyD family secretion protein